MAFWKCDTAIFAVHIAVHGNTHANPVKRGEKAVKGIV
jgi:hypothetical protein